MHDQVSKRAEFEVLACVLAGQGKLCFGNCKPADFDTPSLRHSIKAAKSLLQRGNEITIATICDELAKEGLLTPEVMNDLETASSLEGAIDPEASSKLVREQAARRQLTEEYLAVAMKLEKGELSSHEAAGRIMNRTLQIAVPSTKPSMSFADAVRLADIKHQQIRGGEIVGYKTYVEGLDRRISGIQRGEFVTIQGGSNSCKSLLLLKILLNNAMRKDAKCILYSLEMKVEDLVDRAICMLSSKFNNPSLLRGYLGGKERITEEQWEEIEATKFRLIEQLGDWLFVDDSKTEIWDIFSDIERRTSTGEINELDDWIIGVDYLQIMQGASEDEFTNIKKACNQLKALALSKRFPVIAVSSMDKASQNALGRGEKVKGGGFGSSALSYDPDMILRIRMNDPMIGCDCERIPEDDPRACNVQLGVICNICKKPVDNVAFGDIYVEKGRGCGKGFSVPIKQDLQYLKLVELGRFSRK